VGVSRKLAVGWAKWKLMFKPTNTSQRVLILREGGTTMGHGVMMPTTTPSGCKWLVNNTWRLHWVKMEGVEKIKFTPPSWMVDGKAFWETPSSALPYTKHPPKH
jgi:hypothetical protein